MNSPRTAVRGMSAASLFALVLGFGVIADRPVAAQSAGHDQVDPVLYDNLLIWSEDSGAGHQLRFKRLASNLLPRGGADDNGSALIRSADPLYQPGDQRGPAVADGIVVWSEKQPGGADYDLFAQRLGGAGFSVGAPYRVIERPGDQVEPSLVSTDAGEYLLVWSENGTDSKDIRGQRMSTALRPRGAVVDIATAAGNATEPVIVPDPTQLNSFLVLWTDDRKGNTDIYGTRVSRSGVPRVAAGAAAAAEFAVIEGPNNEASPAAVISARGLSVRDARSVDSRSLVLWSEDMGADGLDIKARRLHTNGYAFGAVLTVADGPGVQDDATVIEGDEGWAVAWSGPGAAKAPDQPATLDLFGVKVNSNGRVEPMVRRLLTD
ncbi:MAG TPA: hypothetical protein PK826_01000 [Anaerolineae bacterium]|nr:hypothetical protein [Anaerolineae bacterium]